MEAYSSKMQVKPFELKDGDLLAAFDILDSSILDLFKGVEKLSV